MATLKFVAGGWICPHCGVSNPDGHNRCGNCEQNPFVLPSSQEDLTVDQLATFKALGIMGLRRRHPPLKVL